MKKLFMALALLAMHSVQAEERGVLLLYVFEEGKPVPGLQVHLDDRAPVYTDRDGALALHAGPGSHRLTILNGAHTLLNHEASLAPGENRQLIVTLNGDQPATVDIETSHTAASVEGQLAANPDAPTGTLTGVITSSENGAPITAARVFVRGAPVDAQTDANGRFQLTLAEGAYALSIVHPDFSTQTVEGVSVTANAEMIRDIVLTPAGVELQEFVVLAPYIEGSVASVIEETRASSEVVDVLGAEQMAKAGDSNAAGALSRVTGLTIEDGKYVVVRGQPSRYTLSLLNGSPLPSPDPIRQVVPLDIFPTGVLSGIEVQKTYSADLPGSFGGGLINLNTRGLPEEGFATFSVSGGLNSESTFKIGLTYDGGSLDFLGIDDGTRAIPEEVVQATESNTSLAYLSQQERDVLGKTFPNNYQVTESVLPPDHGISVAGGRNFDTSYGTFGVLGALSWSRKYRLSNEVDRDFAVGPDFQVEVESEYEETRSDMDVTLGGLLVAGGKWKNHALTSNTFAILNTTKRTEITEGQNNTSDGRYERNFLLEWNQREMLVQQFVGKHDFRIAQLEWRALTANGDRESPDRRTYTYVRMPDGSFVFFEESGGQRRYNTVEDEVDSFGLDLTVPVYTSEAIAAKVKTGAARFEQDRVSDTQRYRFEPNGVSVTSQNPEDVLDPSNIGNGLDFADDTQSNDDYRGNAKVQGVYFMFDLGLYERLRIAAGLRSEQADYEVKTFQSSSLGVEPIVSSFEQDETLPGVTTTWFMNETMQVRAGYSKTLARPMLVELSQTLFFDPDTNETYLGNPELLPTTIDNLDLRWEWYPSPRESFSIGLFQRDYRNPIERNFVPVAGGAKRTTLENADAALVQGIEIGGRVGLGYLNKLGPWRSLDSMYLQGNVSLMESDVQLTESGTATNSARPLQGQADYVLNAQLGYEGVRHDWVVSFNQVGERLDKAGVSGLPDIYRQSVPSLDAAWTWRFADDYKLKVAGANLLNPKIEYVGAGLVERSTRKGASIKASLSWALP